MTKKYLSELSHLTTEFDFSRNETIQPDAITVGSNEKVWWVCTRDPSHIWRASVKNRANGAGCPYCSGRLTTRDNSLGGKYPKLLAEWDFQGNSSDPYEVPPGSSKKIHWICKNNDSHKWAATVTSRTGINKTGCPYCAGSLATPSSSLATKHPELMQEWDYERNIGLDPKKITPRSSLKAWWRCVFNPTHSWKASVGNRSGLKSGCPFCAGKQADDTNSLASLRPDIAKEWALDLNLDDTPDKVTSGSSKPFWWRCSKGHEWKAAVKTRTNGAGCPKCSNQSSRPEARILAELQSLFPDIVSRYRLNRQEIDVFIPSLSIGVEYDGSYYHKKKASQDRRKNEFLKSHGISLVRVRHKPLPRIEDHDVLVDSDDLAKSDLDAVLKSICQISRAASDLIRLEDYTDRKEFRNETLFRDYISSFPSPLPQHSLESLRPDIAAEWDREKNYPLTPRNFSPGSNHRAWWTCQNSHSYQTSIVSRTNEHGCPYCAGNFRLTTNSDERRKWLTNSNRMLSATHPSLAKDWHPTKNGITPDDISAGSTARVWWQCAQNHEWQAPVYNRAKASGPTGCPFCANKKASAENNLASQNSHLALEWNHERNRELKPEQVLPSSGKTVWWVCKKGHEWEAKIAARSRGTGCPLCYREALEANASGEIDRESGTRVGPTKPVRCINTGEVFKSATMAERLLAQRGTIVSASHISAVCRGVRTTAAGLNWEFV